MTGFLEREREPTPRDDRQVRIAGVLSFNTVSGKLGPSYNPK